jgi:hypothetical protein
VWRGSRDIAVGQTCASRRNRHRGHDCPDACAARRVSPLLVLVKANSGRSCVMRKKRKVVMATVPARKRELGLVARTSLVQLQKSTSSILASNKLARSAPKRVAVRVNGGLVGVASGTQVSGTTSANRSWRSAFIQVNGEGPAKAQDDVRASSSGRRMNVERRYGGRGTGAIRATGSYEGSLSVEGISGCHEPSPFTRRWSRRPRRLPHAEKR